MTGQILGILDETLVARDAQGALWSSAPPLLFFARLGSKQGGTLLAVPVARTHDPALFGHRLPETGISLLARPPLRFKSEFLRRPWSLLGHARAVAQLYAQADAVFVRGPTLLLPFVLLFAALKGKTKVTTYYAAGDFVSRNMAGGWPRRLAARIYHRMERLAARRFRLAVAGAALQRRLGGEIIFANLIEDAAIRSDPVTPPRAPLRLIALGNLQRVKGFDVLLDALALLSPGARARIAAVDIYGDGPERQALAEQAGRLELSALVCLHGAMSDRKRLMQQVADADLLVLPSRSEGIPKAILEAAAQGTAVLAARVGGVAELAVPFDAVELVERDDASDLALALTALLEHPTRIAELAQNGITLAREYSMENQLRRFHELISSDSIVHPFPETSRTAQ